MTFKALRTIDYAEKFQQRINQHPSNTYMIAVNTEHTPVLIISTGPRADEWLKDHCRVVGSYKGPSVTVEQLVEDIDHVDPYVPPKFRSAAA